MSGALFVLQSNGRLLNLTANVRIGCKCQTVTDTLDHKTVTKIAIIKRFIISAPGWAFTMLRMTMLRVGCLIVREVKTF